MEGKITEISEAKVNANADNAEDKAATEKQATRRQKQALYSRVSRAKKAAQAQPGDTGSGQPSTQLKLEPKIESSPQFETSAEPKTPEVELMSSVQVRIADASGAHSLCGNLRGA
jgi:hypothetical protein